MTEDIKLPPLPYPYGTPAYRNVGAVIQNYARAAIKADRQRRCEPVSKTYWNNELSSWSDEDFIRIFHERPDLAKRLRKMLADPVKVPSDEEIQALRKDAERIQFVADEGCMFDICVRTDGTTKYRLEWDAGAEWQVDWFDSPSAAIDAAMEDQNEHTRQD